jgi:NAD(P)H-quinone oxidoreductase subunit 5
MLPPLFASLFHIDGLSIVVMALVGFIGTIVIGFATRYLRGDHRRHAVILNLLALVSSVMLLSVSDHVVLFSLLWTLTSLLLIQLMIHHRGWRQAVASGRLAAIYLGTGAISTWIGMAILATTSGSDSIFHIIHTSPPTTDVAIGLGFILIGAMAQSAIFPFHRWLLSSLNSPTPVSAIMHAGIINGGGVLLTRFAPLYLMHPLLLKIMIVVGVITASFGTAFKLVQPDVKRMLACSTMGQMGFMILQCGLGLFPAAISHLVWHGMFKAYFFLDSASAGQYPKLSKPETPSLPIVLIASVGGLLASGVAMELMQAPLFPLNSTAVIAVVVGIAGMQGMITFLQRVGIKKAPIGMILAGAMGGLYGSSVRFVEHFINGLHAGQAQPFSLLHGLVIVILVGLWTAITIGPMITKRSFPRLYVWILNQSQPHPSTITAHRNHYNYGQ